MTARRLDAARGRDLPVDPQFAYETTFGVPQYDVNDAVQVYIDDVIYHGDMPTGMVDLDKSDSAACAAYGRTMLSSHYGNNFLKQVGIMQPNGDGRNAWEWSDGIEHSDAFQQGLVSKDIDFGGTYVRKN